MSLGWITSEIMRLLLLSFPSLQGRWDRFVPVRLEQEAGESGLSGKFNLNSFTWLDHIGAVATGHPSGGRDYGNDQIIKI